VVLILSKATHVTTCPKLCWIRLY